MSTAPRPLALVTGASRGLGAAIAAALAVDHDLVLHARTEAATAETAAACGGAVRARIGAALDDAGALATMIDALGEHAIDVLVCNAGVAPSASLAKTDDALWQHVVDTNLRAPFVLARALAPKMATRGRGRIVNIASTAALKGYRYTVAYAASKGGLVALTRALAAELAGKGVTVNAVCPGFIDTDIVADAARRISSASGRSDAEARASLAKFSPLQRLLAPHEVASLVAYLCSEAAASIHGQAFAIDGGETTL